MLDLKRQYESIKDEVNAAVEGVLTTQHFIGGPELDGFERESAEYLGCERQRWLRFWDRRAVAGAAGLRSRAGHQRHHHSVQLLRLGQFDRALRRDAGAG